MKKVVVLYSGGLDSRVAVKFLKEKDFDVLALHFKLPFGCGSCKINDDFLEKENVELRILDVCRGELFVEYLDVLKNAKYGRGKGFNPCVDCKIWMFRKAKELADSLGIDMIATGEVLGQRPMSQVASAKKKIDDELGFEIFRPLDELGITGRTRTKQMAFAEKYGFEYPTPGGGCLLCEKRLRKRFKFLIKNNLVNERNLVLTKFGKHFFIEKVWYVVARNEAECEVLDGFEKHVVLGEKGKPTIYVGELNDETKRKALELQEAYATGGDKRFDQLML
jgi:predicted subunit of tRNA(5-methylaminomethyl-2-thiouridylate) methyltransferase